MVESPLLKEVRSRGSLERAWRTIEDNGRFSTSEAVRFEIEAFREKAFSKLPYISQRLRRGSFRFPPARAVPIPKGDKKNRSDIRPIVIATVESRIVQRSLLNVLTGIADLQPYFQNPNSFGGIKKSEHQSLAAVPAAIQEVLAAIGHGATYVSCADISGFFTRISKSAVLSIIEEVIKDRDFMDLLSCAIKVELSNMADLRERANKFPIYDIGVAQGNSLSPLLGNLILYEFDRIMNDGDCRCIRYIDDFIILAPSKRAAEARMRIASAHLAKLGMSLSEEKTHTEPLPISDGFEFLGIELKNGLLRPSNKAQARLIKSLEGMFKESKSAFQAKRRGVAFPKAQSLLSTLRRVDGAIQGWGRHYRFCNDGATFAALDVVITKMLRGYIGAYSGEITSADDAGRRTLLGMESLADMQRSPFVWPGGRALKRSTIRAESIVPESSLDILETKLDLSIGSYEVDLSSQIEINIIDR